VSETDRPYTVIYDGTCRICSRSMGRLRRWDRGDRLEIVPSQAPGVRERFPEIPEEAFERSWQLIGPEGRRWEGAAALEELLRLLPRGRWFSWVFRIPLVRSVAERLYRTFARNRHRFGCGEHCPISLRERKAGNGRRGGGPGVRGEAEEEPPGQPEAELGREAEGEPEGRSEAGLDGGSEAGCERRAGAGGSSPEPGRERRRGPGRDREAP